MGFIANGLIKRPILINNNVNMLANSTIYNPIIGSNLGIPLNILQYVFTTTYYHENILNNELILLQFAIGIFTYGTDRLLDAINYNKDVYAAINYLRTFEDIKKSQIYVIGHSRGATAAFHVGIKDSGIKKIVAIGPPRRVSEWLRAESNREYFWERAKHLRWRIYKKEFPSWYTKTLWLEQFVKNDINKHISYFLQELHKPLLLVDGELESEKDRLYLKNY